MDKKFFTDLGIAPDIAERCEKAFNDSLKGFIPKSRFDEVNGDKKRLENEIKDRDKQLEELKLSSGNTEELKKQIEQLQRSNKEKEEQHQADMKRLRIDVAVDKALSDVGAKNKTAVRALLKNLDTAEIREDGTIIGLTEQLENLTKAQDSSFLFEGNNKLMGMSPAANKEGLPDASGYAQQLKDALAKGDTLGAIKIKQLAKADNVIL